MTDAFSLFLPPSLSGGLSKPSPFRSLRVERTRLIPPGPEGALLWGRNEGVRAVAQREEKRRRSLSSSTSIVFCFPSKKPSSPSSPPFFTFLRRPDVPGFCPSNGVVATVCTATLPERAMAKVFVLWGNGKGEKGDEQEREDRKSEVSFFFFPSTSPPPPPPLFSFLSREEHNFNSSHV